MGSALATLVGTMFSGVVSLIICLITQSKNNAIISFKVDELTKRVEKHNNVIERMALAEKEIELLHERLNEQER